jgi:hypothetical protein|tara:strand:+ start:593 stop:727 length:135 start_codon:yes stop_codon:yes gene_type:complete
MIMVEENNTEENLSNLLITKQISLAEYFFRQGAEAMKIKTYKAQ